METPWADDLLQLPGPPQITVHLTHRTPLICDRVLWAFCQMVMLSQMSDGEGMKIPDGKGASMFEGDPGLWELSSSPAALETRTAAFLPEHCFLLNPPQIIVCVHQRTALGVIPLEPAILLSEMGSDRTWGSLKQGCLASKSQESCLPFQHLGYLSGSVCGY